METEYGSTLRRSRRDLIHTREDPLPSTDPPCDDVDSGSATVPPFQSSSTSSEPPSGSAVESLLPSSTEADAPTAGPEMRDMQPQTGRRTLTEKRTRCGRTVKLPVRFQD